MMIGFYVEFWISETNEDEDDTFDFVFNMGLMKRVMRMF